MPSILTNEDLLHAIRAKSQAGAEALFDQYAQVLQLAIYRIVHDRDLTNTLLERTIHQIWDDAALYDGQPTHLLAWMLGIAKELARQQTILC